MHKNPAERIFLEDIPRVHKREMEEFMDGFYLVLWLFFLYSFAGWFLETGFSILLKKRMINRGVLNGPLCTIYGVTALIISIGFSELRNQWFFLFLGCATISTPVEWCAGHFLEKINHKKWWDYSKRKYNVDGYISLDFSILWGILGLLCLKFVNPLLVRIYQWLPSSFVHITLLALTILLLIDILGTYAVAFPALRKIRTIDDVSGNLHHLSQRLIHWIRKRIRSRIEKAYPNIAKDIPDTAGNFASGCSFYKIIMLFFIGSFLGDIIETIFCRLTAGVWMSRSSVVWGPFSIVWGLALACSTILLYNYRNRTDGQLFLIGTILGGVYEYLCSVFTELFFGKIFWDYSHLPFNLGGRINLLYCFFWGFAAVIWLKKVYPVLSDLIEKIPQKAGKIFSWLFMVFMICNIAISSLALLRYNTRDKQPKAQNQMEQFFDTHYDDAKMAKIYPNAKSTN